MTIGEILDLTDISAGMIGDVGGKAANLGELTRAGFPIPPGFCVTTEAYRRVEAAAGLDTVIGTASGDDLASKARARVLETPVPDGLTAAIVAAYRALGTDAMFAVRSSATAEDLPFASFAGQQDSFLGVQGAEAVLDAVCRSGVRPGRRVRPAR